MVCPLSLLVICDTCLDGVWISRPGSSGNAAHHIPGDRSFNHFIDPLAAVKYQTKPSVDTLANSDSAAIVQGNQAHPPGGIAGKTLDCHVSHDVTPIFDIGCLSEW